MLTSRLELIWQQERSDDLVTKFDTLSRELPTAMATMMANKKKPREDA